VELKNPLATALMNAGNSREEARELLKYAFDSNDVYQLATIFDCKINQRRKRDGRNSQKQLWKDTNCRNPREQFVLLIGVECARNPEGAGYLCLHYNKRLDYFFSLGYLTMHKSLS